MPVLKLAFVRVMPVLVRGSASSHSQGISGRRPSFLAIHAKLAKKNISTFWGFEPGTNFCKNSNPGPNFAVAIVVVNPPAPPPLLTVAIFFIYSERAARAARAKPELTSCPDQAAPGCPDQLGCVRLPRPIRVRMVGVWVRNGNSTSTILGNSTSTIWRLATNRYKRFGIGRPEIPWQIIGMGICWCPY